MSKPTCLIIQSGAMGDIFIVAPIAKYYYDKGYSVFWPVREQYNNFVLKYLPYVNAGLIDEKNYPTIDEDWLRSDAMNMKKMLQTFKYDLVIDTSDRDVLPDQRPDESYEEYKYRVAGVPFAMKNHLLWERDLGKEERLIAHIEDNYDIDIQKDRFIVTHLGNSEIAEVPKLEYRKVINITPIITKYDTFEIADWFPIIAKSEAVYCIKSAVHQFIDGCINKLRYENDHLKFYILRLKIGETVSRRWNKKYLEWD